MNYRRVTDVFIYCSDNTNLNLRESAISAITNGDINTLIELRLYGYLDFNGGTMLLAAEKNQIEVMKWLRNYRCPIYQFSAESAVSNGHNEAVRLLYEWGCRFTWRTTGIAAQYNQFETLKLLTELGANKAHFVVESLTKFGNFSHVKWAVMNGYTIGTACSSAAGYGQLEVLKQLRERGYIDSEKKVYHIYWHAKNEKQVHVMRWIRDNLFETGVHDGSWGQYFLETMNQDIEKLMPDTLINVEMALIA